MKNEKLCKMKGNIGLDLGKVSKKESSIRAQGSRIRLLMLDDDKSLLDVQEKLFLQASEYFRLPLDFFGAETLEQAEEVIRDSSPTVMILDKDLGRDSAGEKINGIDHIPHLLQVCPFMNIVMLTSSNKASDATEALKNGAFHYITKTDARNFDCLFQVMQRAHEASENKRLAQVAMHEKTLNVQGRSFSSNVMSDFPGKSDLVRGIRASLKVLSTNIPFSVFVSGPFGSGKGMLSKALNGVSFSGLVPEEEIDYFSVNLALKKGEALVEEVFGVEKDDGSRVILKKGLIDLLRHGTIFFENVSQADSDFEARLIELIEERSFRRVGGEKRNKLGDNRRIVFSDIHTLEELGKKHGLLPDFTNALGQAFEIKLTALKNRPSDVVEVIRALVPYVASKLDVPLEFEDLPQSFVVSFSSNVPVNGVKGIENALVRLINYAPKNKDGSPRMSQWRRYLDFEHVPKALRMKSTGTGIRQTILTANFLNEEKFLFFDGEKDSFPGLEKLKQDLEDKVISEAYEKFESVSRVAKVLKLPKSTLFRKLKDLKSRKGLLQSEGKLHG